MKSALKNYSSGWESELNLPLMEKSADAPLVDYVIDAFKSLEVVKQIKFTNFEYTEKESEIDINKHIFKREKRKKKKDRYDIKFISDDRVGKLTVYAKVTMLETDPTTGTTSYQVYPIKKSILIPLQDENGNYIIKGKPYYLIYQMLEKSTYTSSNSVTLKSLMPIAVKRNIVEAEDVNGNHYNLPAYYVFVFRKEILILLFYMSKGLRYTLDFLNVSNEISFSAKMPKNTDDKIIFQLSTKCFLSVEKESFEKYPYIQSVVGGFVTMCTNRVTMEQLEDTKQWIKRIANPDNYEKGYGILKYFNRLLDETTKKVIKVPEYHKENIYTLLRWMMQEFNELRLKDNCDLKNKRLRCNEYIASLLTAEFSRRLNRIISMGNKVTIDNIKELFKFPGDIIIQKLHTSGILRFDDTVNDMNFWSRLKYTNKGPHSLGGRNANNIGIRYRDLHPSFLGEIDVLVCGNSDPGTSGVLSPFAKIKGLYFDDSDEPDEFYYNLSQDDRKRNEHHHITTVACDFDNAADFYETLEKLQKYTKDNVTVYGTSRANRYEMIINENSDMDDPTQPSTVALAKKKKKKTVVVSSTETKNDSTQQ